MKLRGVTDTNSYLCGIMAERRHVAGILHEPGLSRGARIMWLLLRSRSPAYYGERNVTEFDIHQLATELRCSVPMVVKYQRELEIAGLLSLSADDPEDQTLATMH